MTARDERTCYVTGIHEDVTEDLLRELFMQVGPLESVYYKKNEGGNRFALVLFEDNDSVPFAIETLDEVRLFNKALSVRPKGGSEQEKRYRVSGRRSFDSHEDLGRMVIPPSHSPHFNVPPPMSLGHSSFPPSSDPRNHPSVLAGYANPRIPSYETPRVSHHDSPGYGMPVGGGGGGGYNRTPSSAGSNRSFDRSGGRQNGGYGSGDRGYGSGGDRWRGDRNDRYEPYGSPQRGHSNRRRY